MYEHDGEVVLGPRNALAADPLLPLRALSDDAGLRVFADGLTETITSRISQFETGKMPLLVVPATDVFEAIMVTAQRLDSSRVICGLSNKLTSDEQAKLTGDAWERLPEPRPRLIMEVCAPDGAVREYALGPHTPRMRPQDVAVIFDERLVILQRERYAHVFRVTGALNQRLATPTPDFLL